MNFQGSSHLLVWEVLVTKKPDILTNPDTQKYMANMMQQQIIQNVVKPSKTDFIIRNPNEKTEQLLSESNVKQDKQIRLLEDQLQQEKTSKTELQAKLDDAYIQLRQLNDKASSQNLYIKELKTDLKEESLKRELAENKVSAKDWKVALIAGVIGLITGLACAWFGFFLTTL